MNLFKLTAVQGTDHAFTIDASGGTFTGAETLSAVVTRGDGQAALLSLTPTWSDSAEGQIALSLSAADLADLTPGSYFVLVKAEAVLIDFGTLAVLPNVGVGTPVRSLLTPAEAVGLVPSLGQDQDSFNVLPLLLEAATVKCEEYCGRKLLLSSYDRLYTLNRYAAVILDSRPVPVITRCQSALGVGLEVRYTGSAQRATVTVAPTTPDVLTVSGLTLKSVSSGVETSTALDLADYATISDLATAVAAVSGWTADTDCGTTAATELLGTPGVYGAKDEAFVLPLYAQHLPQYTLDTRRGRLEFDPGVFDSSTYTPNDVRQVAVRLAYRAGYAYLTADIEAGYEPVPADLKVACVMSARTLSDSTDMTTLVKSQTVKDRSYTLNDKAVAIPSVAQTILDGYMDAI